MKTRKIVAETLFWLSVVAYAAAVIYVIAFSVLAAIEEGFLGFKDVQAIFLLMIVLCGFAWIFCLVLNIAALALVKIKREGAKGIGKKFEGLIAVTTGIQIFALLMVQL